MAVVFLAGAWLLLRSGRDDDDEATLKESAAGFWAVAATSFWVIALAITGGRGLRPILPLRWISRLAALVLVDMPGSPWPRRYDDALFMPNGVAATRPSPSQRPATVA